VQVALDGRKGLADLGQVPVPGGRLLPRLGLAPDEEEPIVPPHLLPMDLPAQALRPLEGRVLVALLRWPMLLTLGVVVHRPQPAAMAEIKRLQRRAGRPPPTDCPPRAATASRFAGVSSLVSAMSSNFPGGKISLRRRKLSRWVGASAALPSSGAWAAGTPPSPVTFTPTWICLTFLRPLLVRP